MRKSPLRRITPLRANRRKKRTGRRAEKIRTLKNKLWALFSQYIRRRHADDNGNAACVTCGDVKHWKYQQAGHYVAKQKGLAVYFEERNVHVQCLACNVFKDGNPDQYALFMIKTYGPTILEELDSQRKQIRQIKRAEYMDLIADYQERLKKLEKLPESDVAA